MKMNVKHNKIKNTGILFELLTRRITADVLDANEDSVAVKLMREHFNTNTELGKELMLYRTFFNMQQLSEQKAFQLLNLVTEQRKALNEHKLNLQKYQLIREIKNNYDLKEFFSARIPSYKVYASIYKVFSSAVAGKPDIANINEVMSSQFTIVEHLQGTHGNRELKENTQLSNYLKQKDSAAREHTYKVLIEKFNQKYKGLSSPQKKLLQEYIYNLSEPAKIGRFIQTEGVVLAGELEKHYAKVSDAVVQIKLKEVATQLRRFKNLQVPKDTHVTAMLIGYEILKEVQSL